MSRRRFLQGLSATTGGLAMTSGLAGCVGSPGAGSGEGPVRIGELSPRSGPLAAYGVLKNQAAKLAVQELNEDGGILGREVQLIDPDTGSSNKTAQDLTRRLILEDNVDVIVGLVSSAAREAIRPIIDEHQQLYFYTTGYEGAVCDEYTFVTGAVPDQQVEPLVEYMVNEYGPRCYTIAADYNYGHVNALWAERYLEQYGGEAVGKEFVPIPVSEFGSTLNRLESADPDWIFGVLIAPNHLSYFKQADSQGFHRPLGAVSVQPHQRNVMEAPVLSDVHLSLTYFEDLDTQRNRAFVERFYDNYDIDFINELSELEYTAIKLYANAVEAAGSTDQETVHDELETGTTVEAPSGDEHLDPATHHLVQNVYLARITEGHELEFIDTFEDQEPTWLRERCHLDTEESTWDNPVTANYVPEA